MALNPAALAALLKQADDDHKSRITPTNPSVPVTTAVIEASLLVRYSDIANAICATIATGTVAPGIPVQVVPLTGTGTTIGPGVIS